MILSNERAFLALISFSEGTAKSPDPYRVCYGYRHTIQSLAEHPAVTQEWRGEKLPDAMCANAGLKPGCVSTAAGKYQLIKPTWLACKAKLGLTDFSPDSQDRAALLLVSQRGALTDIHNGDIAKAIAKCSGEWASLPGNRAGQPQRPLGDLLAAFKDAGGVIA
jgi:muramidase (phage lysozyme)